MRKFIHMKKGVAAFLFVSVFLLQNERSFAWGKTGHELVAQIAFHFLDDSTKKIVKSYLGNLSIEEAANWMDDAKSNTYYNYMRTWHYVNVEKGETYKPTTERDIVTVLHSAIEELKNYKNEKRKDVKRDLLLLFHLIGDLHQPLHVGYGSDRGGNSVEINSPVVSGNLHSVWDSQIIDNKGINLDSCLALFPSLDSNQINEIQKINVMGWMRQSRTLLDTAYSFQNNYLSAQYVDNNVRVIERQLLLGGLRLASVLKIVFNPGSQTALAPRS